MGQCVLHQSERENMSYMSMDCLSPPKSPEAGVSSRTTDSLMASLTMAPRKPFGHVRLTNFLHELSEWTKGEFMMSSNRVFGYKFHKSTRVVILYTTVTYISAGIQLYKSPEGGQLKNQQPSKSPSSASAQKRAFSSCCGTKGMCGNASQRHSFIS